MREPIGVPHITSPPLVRRFPVGDSLVLAALPHIPVAGRLSWFLQFWRSLTSDKWVLDVVALGHSLQLLGLPSFNGLIPTKPPSRFVSAMSEEVKSLLQKGAVVPVPPYGTRDGFYSTYFIVPKKDGSLRPILNLKQFNLYITRQPFKMETLSTIIGVTFQGQWLASIDLKDAYFHVGILKDHSRFLRFLWQGSAYQFQALPFGLSSAPRVFTKLLQPLVAFLRTRGIVIYIYLDDILVTARSQSLVLEALRCTMQVLLRAGFMVNLTKSELSPTQDLVYIGGRFRTDLGMVFLPPRRKEALLACVRTFLRVGQYKPAHHFLRLLGLLAACLSVVKLARLHMRPIQWHVKIRWAPHMGLNAPIVVTLSLVGHLQWWLSEPNLERGLLLQPPSPELRVTTDASMEGWGGYLHGPQNTLLQGLWSPQEQQLHINLLELRAIRLTLMGLDTLISGKSVLLESDNSTTVAYVNKQGGVHSFSLNEEARLLYHWTLPRGITVLAIHRPGVDNTLADSLSRHSLDSREWSLHQSVVERLFSIWGTPQLDLFATSHNAKLPLFCSRIAEPGALTMDAFSLSWEQWETYAFPPIPLIPRVLTKLQTDKASMILVAPMWPRRPWFPQLLLLSCDVPRILPLSPHLLSQTLQAGVLYHQNTTTLRLVAWRLSGDSSKTKAFRSRLSTSCSHPEGRPLVESMTHDGMPLSAGAVHGTLIPLQLL